MKQSIGPDISRDLSFEAVESAPRITRDFLFKRLIEPIMSRGKSRWKLWIEPIIPREISTDTVYRTYSLSRENSLTKATVGGALPVSFFSATQGHSREWPFYCVANLKLSPPSSYSLSRSKREWGYPPPVMAFVRFETVNGANYIAGNLGQDVLHVGVGGGAEVTGVVVVWGREVYSIHACP